MKYILTTILFLSCFCLAAQKTTKVTITQEGYDEKHGLRVAFNNRMVESDSTGNLVFEKEMEINEPIYGIVIQNNGKYSGFWLEPGATHVVVSKWGFPQSLKVPGSKSHKIYQSVKHAKDKEAFKKNFLANKDNPIALEVLNSTFKFKELDDDELKMLYGAVSQENQHLVGEVGAYINTLDIDKVTVDSQMMDFIGEDQEGNVYDTKNYRGKYLLLDFAATGCGPCWAGYPDMQEEASKYDQLQVITYNQDDAIDGWNEIAKNKNIKLDWPVLWKGDKKKEVFEVYNVEGWPLHFLISPEGKVLETWYGSGGTKLADFLKKHIKKS